MSLLSIVYLCFTYMLTSISSAVIISRLFRLKQDSSLSTTLTTEQVLKIGGIVPTSLVLLLDLLKGMIPVWSGHYIGFTQFELGMIALAACLGHSFPVFYKFRGGKGVATAFGAIAPISWSIAIFIVAVWLITLLIVGYTAISATFVALTVPFYVWWVKPEYTFPVALVCCLLVYRHHDDLQRIWRKQETRVWQLFTSKHKNTLS